MASRIFSPEMSLVYLVEVGRIGLTTVREMVDGDHGCGVTRMNKSYLWNLEYTMEGPFLDPVLTQAWARVSILEGCTAG
ncbi:hypothetical protein VMCG_08006 [Cytospora schulzeri]|uniref:Uncharacterized protein n=1 Tax=Cytospora schulzeri TaxID=448051 RepID=A0A423VYB7_9PEZI|nr:hypothetical protein VMCG_08006 [Valsa malicola]